MTCCNRDCDQGDTCPYRARAAALARALLCILSAAAALAVWLRA